MAFSNFEIFFRGKYLQTHLAIFEIKRVYVRSKRIIFLFYIIYEISGWLQNYLFSKKKANLDEISITVAINYSGHRQ